MPGSNLSCPYSIVKYLIFVPNLLFFLSGLVLITVGGLAQGFFKEYVQFFNNELSTPAMAVIVLGCVILFISFFGCCGAKKENICMLRTFAGLMGIILILELAGGIAVAIMKSQVTDLLEENMHKSMTEYGVKNGSVVTLTWDEMQKDYACCGTKNSTDWEDTWFYTNHTDSFPGSCCAEPTEGLCKDSTSTFPNGCFNALQEAGKSHMVIIAGVALGIAVLQAIGIWMSCCLIKGVRERYEIL